MPSRLKRNLEFEQFNPFACNVDEYVILNWTTLKLVYPNLCLYGGPTFILPIQSYYIVGTTKGDILIFNSKQFVQTVLSPNMPEFRSKVINIDLNQDGTHLCAGYESGDIFLWDLNASTDNVANNHIFPVLHIGDHCGNLLTGLDFIPGRHTSILASDSTGTIVLHKGTRNHLWQLIPTSKVVMRLNPMKNTLVMTKVRNSDSENHLVAILCSRSLAIISLAPEFSTQVIISIQAWNSLHGSIAWNDFDNKMVCFSFGVKVQIVKVDDPHFRWIYEATENICKVSWVTKEIISILTVSSRLLLLNTVENSSDKHLHIMSLDLLVHDLMVPNSQNHFSVSNSKLVMLTNYSLKVGTFNTWSDILLHYIHQNDYINALGILGFFLQTSNYSTLFDLLKLEPNYETRKQQVEPSFTNLALVSMNFFKKKNNYSYESLQELLSLIVCIGSFFSHGSSTSFLDKAAEIFQDNSEELFEVIYDNICGNNISHLSPTLFKSIIEYNVKKKYSRKLETILLSLDPSTLDLDFAFNFCKKFHLYDTLVYLWIRLFDDYMTPLIDSIHFFATNFDDCTIFDNGVDKMMPFSFIKAVLLGKLYPTEDYLDFKKSLRLKNDFYSLIFHASSVFWPPNSNKKLLTQHSSLPSNEPGFPYATLFLNDSPRYFLEVLDAAFEEADFNDSPHNGLNFTRQNIIDILIDIAQSSVLDETKLQISIFACRNITKFSQFIRVSGIILERLIDTIVTLNTDHLDDAAENSLEAILSVYTPVSVYGLIEKVRVKQYQKVLLILLKKSNNFTEYLKVVLESIDQNESDYSILNTLTICLEGSKSNPIEQVKLIDIIAENFENILRHTSDMKKTVSLIEEFDPKLHEQIFLCKNSERVKQYLECFFDGTCEVSNECFKSAKTKYLLLLYESNDRYSILNWVKQLDITKSSYKELLKIIDDHADLKTSIHLLIKIQDYNLALKRINKCITKSLKELSFNELSKFVELGVFVANETPSNENWVKLISNMIILYPTLDENGKNASEKCLQRIFIEMSDSNRLSSGEVDSNSFWLTMMQIFENQELILSKIKELKIVLQNIYAAYSLEETLKKLVSKILSESTRNELSLHIVQSKKGWPIHSHECEVCEKKLWGYGIDDSLFDKWEMIRLLGNDEDSEGDLLVFSCGHGFHLSCLKNLGQHQNFKCLTCNRK